jgi:hypothetical protein
MKVAGQLGMDETAIDDPELNAALEARYTARLSASALAAQYKTADKAAKSLIDVKVPAGTIARVGRFRVERKPVAARHVDFDVPAGVRVNIDAVDAGVTGEG